MEERFPVWLLPVLAAMMGLLAVTYFAPHLISASTFIVVAAFLIALGFILSVMHAIASIRSGVPLLTALHPVLALPVLAAICLFGDVGGVGTALWRYATTSSLEANGIQFSRAADGHFRPMIDVNGKPLHFVVNTESKHIVLSQSDARQVGIEPVTLTFDVSLDGPIGPQSAAAVVLRSVSLFDISIANVPALVASEDLETSILGHDFFDRTSDWAIEGDVLMVLP